MSRVAGKSVVEKTISVDDIIDISFGGITGNLVSAGESTNGVGECIEGISVVERLGTKSE